MLNKLTNYINLISLIIIIYISFYFFHPSFTQTTTKVHQSFFIESALKHVENLSKEPHYLGSKNHKKIKDYLVDELQKLGLKVKRQKTSISRHYDRSNRNISTEVENIFAVIKGTEANNKSILLMSHYDSAPYTSLGASDAASGVAVILEGIRSFIQQEKQSKNDIVILFTDAEELGLLGAKAFVNKNALAKNIGVVLNFEARGSSGNSFMLMDTPAGNRELLNAFKEADIEHPNSSSLHYSIYKLLPNDMDMTIFREDGNIQGYNFAFIDDHFNYHTYLDNYDNLSLDSLAHQAHYLMPLLDHFSQADLDNLVSDQDDVFFQIPIIKTVSYPFSSTMMINIISLIMLVIVLIYGIKGKHFTLNILWQSFIPLLKSIVVSLLLGVYLLKFLYWLNPQHDEIRQGFAYNGYEYIAFFYLLSASVCLWFYQRNKQKPLKAEHLIIAPIILFLLVGFLSSLYLPGAHFISLTSLFLSLALLIKLRSKKLSNSLFLFVLIPPILVLMPLIHQIPVAIGLTMTPYAGVLIILLVASLAPSLIESDAFKISAWLLFLTPLTVIIYAESKSSVSPERPLPVSLNYYQNSDNQAYWISYDKMLSAWTKPYFESNKSTPESIKQFRKQEKFNAKQVAQIESKSIPTASFELKHKRQYSDKDVYKIQVQLKRKVNKLHLRSLQALNIYKLKINDFDIVNNYKASLYNADSIISTIHNNTMPIFDIELEVASGDSVDLSLIEISHDLLSAGIFDVPARAADLIAKPAGYSDLVITKTKATF